MLLFRNGDGGGEARDEADCVSESGRIDAMAPGPLAGCDATSMILTLSWGYESTSASSRTRYEDGSKRDTRRVHTKSSAATRSNAHESLNAGGRLKLPMNRID